MSAKRPRLGKSEGNALYLDPAAMVASHMAIIASSGGGKSWLLRLILEQTFGLFPHIVIDVEGELKTLRERFDYIIASADDEGDCVAHPRSAALLARRLLETNASCIVDIYELKDHEQVDFVRNFLKALVDAPKKLWGPRLVVIDEAQLFAPENKARGQASRGAVIDLLGRGRKRGLSTILASQRLSKVSNDAIGECRNKIYGFCNLPTDRKRATEDLGFLKKADQQLFRELDTGVFYAVGPAVSKREVIKLHAGDVATTHPRPGDGIVAHTPPPRARVRKLIAEFSDLPELAEAEIVDLVTAKKKIKALEGDLRQASAGDRRARPRELEVSEQAGLKQGRNESREQLAGQAKEIKALVAVLRRVKKAVGEISPAAEYATSPVGVEARRPPATQPPPPPPQPRPLAIAPSGNGEDLPKGEAAIMTALLHAPTGTASRDSLTTMTGYKKSTRNNYLQKLLLAGMVEESGDGFAITGEGRDRLGDVAPLPSGYELLQHYLDVLPRGESEILACIAEARPEVLSRDEVSEITGYKKSTRNNYIGKLVNRQLVTANGAGVAASDLLF